MALSVIIVNYNTQEKLQCCLQSVFHSAASYKPEVWVVDNGSSDCSVEMVRKEFPEAKLLINKENLGYARANNQTIKKILESRDKKGGEGSGSRYILLLNPDVVVAPETFDKMISFMDNNPAVGISGCKVVKADGKLDLACRRSFPNPANALFRVSGLSFLFPKSRFSSYNLTFLPEDEICEVDSVMGAFLLIRIRAIKQIGFLDEDFFMYGEDLDWSYRVKSAGFKVMYVPVTTVVHDKGSSSRKLPRKALYEFHRAMQLFYDKHYRGKYNFLLNWLVRCGIWTRFLVLLVVNSFRREKYVSR